MKVCKSIWGRGRIPKKGKGGNSLEGEEITIVFRGSFARGWKEAGRGKARVWGEGNMQEGGLAAPPLSLHP